jgi:hypothetical protein
VTAPTTAPTLTDGVVTLRAHRPDDVPRMVEQCRDPMSIAWTTVPVPYAESDAEEYGLQVLPAGWADGTEWAFAVELEGRYAGTVSLRDEGPGRAEIAYGSHPDVRGTGAVLRALRLLNPGGHLITCTCSAHVDEGMFGGIILSAATDARIPVVVVEKRMQARDHPVLLGVPETYYLKCFVLRRAV